MAKHGWNDFICPGGLAGHRSSGVPRIHAFTSYAAATKHGHRGALRPVSTADFGQNPLSCNRLWNILARLFITYFEVLCSTNATLTVAVIGLARVFCRQTNVEVLADTTTQSLTLIAYNPRIHRMGYPGLSPAAATGLMIPS